MFVLGVYPPPPSLVFIPIHPGPITLLLPIPPTTYYFVYFFVESPWVCWSLICGPEGVTSYKKATVWRYRKPYLIKSCPYKPGKTLKYPENSQQPQKIPLSIEWHFNLQHWFCYNQSIPVIIQWNEQLKFSFTASMPTFPIPWGSETEAVKHLSRASTRVIRSYHSSRA